MRRVLSSGHSRRKCRLRPACQKLPGLSREKCRLRPACRKLPGLSREKHGLHPICRKLPGLSREKIRITPRLSETSGAQQRKTRITPRLSETSGAQQRKTRITPRLSETSGAQQRKTRITPRLSETPGAQQRKNVDYKAFRNVGYNKCRDAHRGRMFRLLWTFVDLKLPSAMSHAIHKIVSKERCHSYFISRRSPHLGISKDSELCASAHRCLHYAYARLIARVAFHSSYKKAYSRMPFSIVSSYN